MFLINGEASDALNLSDRALHYGDGLFETIAVRKGRIEFWQRHMQRLSEGCQRIGMPVPDVKLLLKEARRLIQEDGVLKIIVSRGEGGRGYRAPFDAQAKRIIGFYPLPHYSPEFYTNGIVLTVCNAPLGISPALAGIKHLNRLEQVMARSEWSDEQIQEGLMLNANGHVIEGTMTNLFFVRNGRLCTPKLDISGIAGVARQVVIDVCRELNIELHMDNYSLEEVLAAEEVFVTNSIAGIWPVKLIEEKIYSIGDVTKQLQQKFAQYQQRQGEYENAN